MKIGFLGAGAMGGAILSGAINAGVLDPKQVYVSDMSDKIKEKYAALGCNIVKDNEELGRAADIAVLAVKPQYAAPALAGFGSTMDGKAVISIMAGVTVERLRKMIAGNIRVLRTMPNTPALVNAGAFALCSETDLTADEKAFAEKLFGSIGIVEWMNENLRLRSSLRCGIHRGVGRWRRPGGSAPLYRLPPCCPDRNGHRQDDT